MCSSIVNGDRRGSSRWWAGMLLFSLAVPTVWPAAAAAQPVVQEAKSRRTEEKYTSAGKPIRVWRFDPPGPGPHPALLLLHGVDTWEAHEDAYCSVAEKLAAQGYAVFMIHYFDRTRDNEKDMKLLKDIKPQLAECTTEEQKKIKALFREWMEAVSDGVAHARKQPQVDGKRVGLGGFSLGAYLAVAVATQKDLRIGAVVEFFGGLPSEVKKDAQNLPPVLVIAGHGDDVVPLKEAQILRDLLEEKLIDHEFKFFRDVGHMFMKPNGQLDLRAVNQAQNLAVSFLGKHLKNGRTGETDK